MSSTFRFLTVLFWGLSCSLLFSQDVSKDFSYINPIQQSKEIDSLSYIVEVSKGSEKVEALIQLANIHIKTDPNQAHKYIEIAVIISDEINDKRLQGKSLLVLNRYYHINKQYLSNITSGLTLLYTDLPITDSEKSNVYIYLITALEYFQMYDLCLVYSRELNNLNIKKSKYQQFYDVSQLAGLYLKASLVEDAIKTFSRALAIAKDQGDRILLIHGHNNLGFAYSKQSQLDSALFYYKKALIHSDCDDEGCIIMKGTICGNMGLIFYKHGEIDKAIKYLKIDKNISLQYGLNGSVMDLNLKLSDAYIKKEDFQNAKLYADSALYYFKEIKNDNTHWVIEVTRRMEAEVNAYQILSKIYELQNQPETSLKYYKIFVSKKDSLQEVRKKGDKLGLNLLSKIDNYKLILDKKKHQQLINEAQIKTKSIINYSLITGFIIILIFGFLLYLRQRKVQRFQKESWELKQKATQIALQNSELQQQQLDEQLVYQTKQITNFALHFTEKAELLNSLTKKLKALQRNVKIKKTEGEIQNLIILINQSLDINKERVLLNKEVELLNETFFFTLSKKYPEITEKEKKIAALLRINLPSKNIASIYNITSATIDNHRYSLRKKLNLKSKESLSGFLKNI